MKCVIIAAGKGKRISNLGSPKPLIPLLGLPLIERTILTAKEAGIDEFFVVIGYKKEEIRDFLDKLRKRRGIKISWIINEEYERGNGISLLKVKPFLKEKFVLLMCDHIFDKTILSKLITEPVRNEEIILCVDKNIRTNKLINLEDATKVFIEEDRIVNIGKEISEYNGYDTGIFLCSCGIFEAIEESIGMGDDSLSGGVKVLAKKMKAKAYDIKDAFWLDIDDEKSYRRAEKVIVSGLKKLSDGLISRYFNRPISTKITKLLLSTPITPNFISFFSFLLSIIGGIFFFFGGYLNLVIGGILAQISSIIDGCDGEIARLKFQVSEFGGWFDAVLDRYADTFLLFGLTWYIFEPCYNLMYLGVGFLAIIGSFMNSYTADKYDGLMKKKLGSKKLYLRIGRDLRIFIIFIGALTNQVFLTLLFTTFITNLENIRRIVFLYLEEKQATST